jgi:hypothetical protein
MTKRLMIILLIVVLILILSGLSYLLYYSNTYTVQLIEIAAPEQTIS